MGRVWREYVGSSIATREVASLIGLFAVCGVLLILSLRPFLIGHIRGIEGDPEFDPSRGYAWRFTKHLLAGRYDQADSARVRYAVLATKVAVIVVYVDLTLLVIAKAAGQGSLVFW